LGRNDLIDHDLRPLAQAIGLGRLYGRPKQGGIHKVTGDGQNGHCSRFVEAVGLDDQGGTRFTEVALRGIVPRSVV
jgi:hypothetical protein